MKKFIFVTMFFAFWTWNSYSVANNSIEKTSLSGKITDNQTGLPLLGVVVYCPDLKTGTTTDENGKYLLENLPKTKILIQVSFVGYKMIAEVIDLAEFRNYNFSLKQSITELHEVVVTGLSSSAEQSRIPTPISVVPNENLFQSTSSNIIQTLAKQPGIDMITTGPGIAKPVIRGLGYNRIIILNDGIRQEGQQWGDEHGIEIDEFAVNKVEILKGPASLAYGSDALAGVINMLSAYTLPEGKIEGKLLAGYQTNNGLISTSANLAGSKKGLMWDLRFSNKLAHAYKNKFDGYVLNSGFRENAQTAIVGINRVWGFSRLNMSMYSLSPGIIEGERDSITGEFIKPIVLNGEESTQIASNDDFFSYNSLIPFQKVNHYKIVFSNSLLLGSNSLKSTFGWQQNRRKEYADIMDLKTSELYFLLNSFHYDLHYIIERKDNLKITAGVNGMQQSSQNKGIEFLIPEYSLFDAGVYAMIHKSLNKLTISGGIRYDTRFENGKDLFLDSEGNRINTQTTDSYQQFKAFNSINSGFSGSLGASYLFSEVINCKLNFSKGFRAPNIGEIGSNGIHEGTLRYEIGDPDLKSESSLQVDYSLEVNTEHISANMDLFTNQISNYIYSIKLESTNGADSIRDGASAFRFTSGNANLSGGEITLDIHPHPLDWIHFENTFSIVHATLKNQADSTKYLPNTPSSKYISELKATANKLGNVFGNAFFSIGFSHYFKQNNVFLAYDTETETPAYSLFNASAGADVMRGTKKVFTFYISANNIFDVAYQNHLSRLKYAPNNNATGRSGVYEMGRNIGIKLLFPISLSQK